MLYIYICIYIYIIYIDLMYYDISDNKVLGAAQKAMS